MLDLLLQRISVSEFDFIPQPTEKFNFHFLCLSLSTKIQKKRFNSQRLMAEGGFMSDVRHRIMQSVGEVGSGDVNTISRELLFDRAQIKGWHGPPVTNALSRPDSPANSVRPAEHPARKFHSTLGEHVAYLTA